jgi:hypothetical protein
MPVRLERNPISDLELEHLLMSPHLLEESEPLNDSAIEIDELRFGQLVDIDGHLLLRQHRAGQYPRTGGAVDQAALSHGLIASMGGPFGKDFVALWHRCSYSGQAEICSGRVGLETRQR